MVNCFSPERGFELAHPLFDSILGTLDFFLLLVESFEGVVFFDNYLRATIEQAWEVRVSSFPDLPRPEWFFLSHISPAVSSLLFSSCIPCCPFSIMSLFLPLLQGSSWRPRFPIGGSSNSHWNNTATSWFRDEPCWPFVIVVLVVGPSPLVGSLPSPVTSRGRGRPSVGSISWWIVGTSLTLVSRLDGFDIHHRPNPSGWWRRVPPLFLVSPSCLG